MAQGYKKSRDLAPPAKGLGIGNPLEMHQFANASSAKIRKADPKMSEKQEKTVGIIRIPISEKMFFCKLFTRSATETSRPKPEIGGTNDLATSINKNTTSNPSNPEYLKISQHGAPKSFSKRYRSHSGSQGALSAAPRITHGAPQGTNIVCQGAKMEACVGDPHRIEKFE